MRHRKRGRILGRSPSHRKAMMKNLASALFLTERETDDGDTGSPKVKGRIVTTLPKAKEIRPYVERCITVARRAIVQQNEAQRFGTNAERNSAAWKEWRKSTKWKQWAQAMAPVVAARRKLVQLLGDKDAVKVLFDEVAPRFSDRNGGYTRILKLAKPRLGDAGARAALEFVGVRDRKVQRSERPSFGDEGGES
jgi:large subunit ribosomal protein L17